MAKIVYSSITISKGWKSMLRFSNEFGLDIESDHVSKVVQRALAQIKNEKESREVGYYTLPDTSLSLTEEVKSIGTDSIEQLVIIGIGGSSLGIKAIDAILRPYSKDTKEILYLENSDPLTISNTLEKIHPNKALFFVISKSGSTIETTSIFKTVIGYHHLDLEGEDAKRVVIITDEGSVLSEFAAHYGLQVFHIPHNVGGRFSVLSAVGVVPLALAGYDMHDLLDGARQMTTRFFDGDAQHILQKAAYLFFQSSKEPMNVLFSYSDTLEEFTKWYVQLWGESLGKINQKGEKVGLTPIGLIGAIDQHSFLQLIIEGPRDKNVTFIKIEDFQKELTIPDISLFAIEKTDFINNQSFNRLINAQCDATMQSLNEAGVTTDMIVMDRVTPSNIGEMLIYFELLTSLVGAMFEVNTYNQPGVELGKQILYKNLGSGDL